MGQSINRYAYNINMPLVIILCRILTPRFHCVACSRSAPCLVVADHPFLEAVVISSWWRARSSTIALAFAVAIIRGRATKTEGNQVHEHLIASQEYELTHVESSIRLRGKSFQAAVRTDHTLHGRHNWMCIRFRSKSALEWMSICSQYAPYPLLTITTKA